MKVSMGEIGESSYLLFGSLSLFLASRGTHIKKISLLDIVESVGSRCIRGLIHEILIALRFSSQIHQ